MSAATKRISNLAHNLTPLPDAAHSKVTISSTIITASTSGVVASGDYYRIQVETNPVRVTYSATNPDATTGLRYVAGAEILLSRAEWLAAKWIREGASDATLQVVQLA